MALPLKRVILALQVALFALIYNASSAIADASGMLKLKFKPISPLTTCSLHGLLLGRRCDQSALREPRQDHREHVHV